MSHPSVVFRMSFLKQSEIRYRADYFPAEDYKMWIDCMEQTEIYNIPEILVYYRQHNDQITQGSNMKQVEMTNIVRLEMLTKIYPTIKEEEKVFHIKRFLGGNITSQRDYRDMLSWSNVILYMNKESGNYMNSELLKSVLYKYVQAKYKSYVIAKYFQKFTFKAWLKYFLSLEWIQLSFKRNIKLLIKNS